MPENNSELNEEVFTPEPPAPIAPLVSVELTKDQKKDQYLAATREYCEAEAALNGIVVSDGAGYVAAKERVKKAEARRALVERFADCVSDAEVAAITKAGVWGRG